MDKNLLIIESGRPVGKKPSQGYDSAQIDSQICFDTDALDSFDVNGCESIHYDILVLCAAIEFADRRWERPRQWYRRFNITVPVCDPLLWQRPEVLHALSAALRHLTGDSWHFDFVEATVKSPIGLKQMQLQFESSKTFVIAYSEGLDSRAVSALSGNANQALRIRVSANRQLRHAGEGHFTRIPFKVGKFSARESSFRSRGFQFASVATIAAHLAHIPRIVVPESGQGALGPALIPLHNVHIDYRNHPTFFRQMERFFEALLGYRVHFDQPRLWSTKGQTLRAYLDLKGKTAQDFDSTRSCWQSRHIVNISGKRRQCGLCAACLLRRFSLYAAGIVELSDAYVVSDLSVSDVNSALSLIKLDVDRRTMLEYGIAGIRHFHHLAGLAFQPDEVLKSHASEIAVAINADYRDTLDNLRKMLSEHARELQAFLTSVGRHSFLHGWTGGGRYD
jgi:hypothetical protein